MENTELSYYDKYKTEIDEIAEHMRKVRNKSLKQFLWVYLHMYGIWDGGHSELPKPNLKDRMDVENICHIATIKEIPLVSKRTAYDIQHAIAAVDEIDDLFSKWLSDERG